MKARTHEHAEITHCQNQFIISIWKALGLQHCASHALIMNVFGKCAISTWAWVLAILLHDKHCIAPVASDDSDDYPSK